MKNVVFALAFVVALTGCGDPEKIRFVDLCSDNGYSQGQCSCMFDTLENDVEDIDDEYVSFLADFAKWDYEDNGGGLDRAQMMEKYQLSEDEYVELTVIVGTTLPQAIQLCG